MKAVQSSKKLLAWGLVFLILWGMLPFLTLSAAGPAGTQETILGQVDSGRQIEVGEDQVVTLRLEDNPSTGYEWQVETMDQAILRVIGEPEFEPGSVLLGAPGTRILRFRPVGAGRTSLILAYRRPWEDHAPLQTFTLDVQTVGLFEQIGEQELPTPPVPSPAPAAIEDEQAATALPSAFNWCDQNGCTPVKDQGYCGSCWAFATVGSFESVIQAEDGVTRDLAEQYLLSCNTEGYSCKGGWWVHDYHKSEVPPGEPAAGAVYEADFAYKALKVSCNPPHSHHEKIVDWDYVGSGGDVPSSGALKQAIYDHGPIAVAVCTGSAFQGYDGGVFATNETCSGTVNHGVVLVGWDDGQGTGGVWYLRNSWGPNWGENGYMRIAYGTSSVGFGASYVIYQAAPQSPTAPTGLQATAISESRINLTWTDTCSNETGFKVERSPDGSTGWQQIATVGPNATTYANTGLPAATRYYYRVRAYNQIGDSDWSNVTTARTFGGFTTAIYLPIVAKR